MSVKPLLDSVLVNIEERDWWMSGRFRDPDDSHLFVELSFEEALKVPNRYWIAPTVPVIYFGLHGRRHTVAEFFMGRWSAKPTDPEIAMCVSQVLYPLRNYTPRRVIPVPDLSFYLSMTGTHSHAL